MVKDFNAMDHHNTHRKSIWKLRAQNAHRVYTSRAHLAKAGIKCHNTAVRVKYFCPVFYIKTVKSKNNPS